METIHLFIVNPTAGKKDMSLAIAEKAKSLGLENTFVEITKGKGHATKIAGKWVKNSGGKFVRIYACGGDGTINEVINGVCGLENCAVGGVPIGTGNDFLRTFEEYSKEDFLNLENMTRGKIKTIDLLECEGHIAMNEVSVGYDCAVAKNVVRFKGIPLVGGSLAYKLSIVYCLFSKLRHRFELFADGKPMENNGDEYLLAVFGNGKYYGGGIKGAPEADPFDGFIDMVYISRVSAVKFLRLVSKFIKGLHTRDESCSKHVVSKRCKAVDIKTNGFADISVDGEIYSMLNPKIRIREKAVSIILPAKTEADFMNQKMRISELKS